MRGVGMKIAAVVKIKHGAIWEALQKLNWNQSDLARKCKMQPSRVGEIINLKTRPYQGEVDKIELAFLDGGICVDVLSEWPEMFRVRKNNLTYYKDIETDRMLKDSKPLTLEEKEYMQILLNKLSDIEADVLISHIVQDIPLNELSKKWNLSCNRMSQVKEELELKLEKFRLFIDKDGVTCPEQFGMYLGKHYPSRVYASV